MLRRPASILQLGQEDVDELIAELEEEKLQLRVQSQRRNLVRPATSSSTGELGNEDTMPGDSDTSSVQISPLNGKRLQLDQAEGPPTATLSWSNRQVSRAVRSRDRERNETGAPQIEDNPFYRDDGV